MPWEEFNFWGEKAPLTVEDPDIVAEVAKKLADKLIVK